MSKRIVFLALMIVACLFLNAQAQTIVWVSEWNDDSGTPYDQGWVDLLRDQGYNVIADTTGTYETLDAAKIATMDNADLVIVSRNTNSGGYIDGEETTQWNSVDTPLILLSGYIPRSSRWQWINSGSTEEFSSESMMEVVDSSHPMFAGVTIENNEVDMIDGTVNDGEVSFISSSDIGNGTLIAQRSDNGNIWIAEWAAGVEFYSGTTQVPADKRMLFTAGGSGGQESGSLNLTEQGKQIFLNAVRYMLGIEIDLTKASEPQPGNDSGDVLRNVILSWKPGIYPGTHTIYFGTDFNDVNDGAALISEKQADTTYDLGSLDFGTTYYWRVDEVNDSADATVYTGNIWSFTTEAYALKIPSGNITASASSQASDIQVPENTINESGLDPNHMDLHTKITQDMWSTDPAAFGEPAWIQYDFDKVYKLHQMLVWNYNGEVILSGFGVKDVNIEYSEDGQTWNQLADANQFAKAPGTTGYEYNTTVDFNGLAAKSVRINILSNWGGGLYNQYGLSEVRFMYIPVRAREPYPADMNDVPTDVTLSWRAGREAQQHIVSLSTDQQAVSDGNAVITTIGEASYGPLSLDLGSTYYWRIDEVNDTATPTTWIGDVWNFNTQEYIVVEDFERYTDDDPNRIWDVWSDGWDDNNNGSTMGYPNPDFIAGEHYVETDIVHGGEQSAPIFYDNSSATYSEVSVNTSNLAIGSDWAPGSPETLVLWFYGDPNNTPADMYIKINSKKVSYQGDPDNLTRPRWNQLNIDLSEFGVDIGSITTLVIGFERTITPAVESMVFVDDIRLYREAPPIAEPVEPGSEGLVASYSMENDVQDSSGNDLHGTVVGAPVFVQGKASLGTAIELNGTNNYIDCGTNASFDITEAITVSAWVKTNDAGNSQHNPYITKGDQSFGLKHSNANSLQFFIYDSGYHTINYSISSAFNGVWHHVAGAYDGSQLNLYLDGGIVATLDYEGAIATTTYEVNIGRNSQNTDRLYEGAIDEVRIYNRALSEGEVLYLSNQ